MLDHLFQETFNLAFVVLFQLIAGDLELFRQCGLWLLLDLLLWFSLIENLFNRSGNFLTWRVSLVLKMIDLCEMHTLLCLVAKEMNALVAEFLLLACRGHQVQ